MNYPDSTLALKEVTAALKAGHVSAAVSMSLQFMEDCRRHITEDRRNSHGLYSWDELIPMGDSLPPAVFAKGLIEGPGRLDGGAELASKLVAELDFQAFSPELAYCAFRDHDQRGPTVEALNRVLADLDAPLFRAPAVRRAPVYRGYAGLLKISVHRRRLDVLMRGASLARELCDLGLLKYVHEHLGVSRDDIYLKETVQLAKTYHELGGKTEARELLDTWHYRDGRMSAELVQSYLDIGGSGAARDILEDALLDGLRMDPKGIELLRELLGVARANGYLSALSSRLSVTERVAFVDAFWEGSLHEGAEAAAKALHGEQLGASELYEIAKRRLYESHLVEAFGLVPFISSAHLQHKLTLMIEVESRHLSCPRPVGLPSAEDALAAFSSVRVDLDSGKSKLSAERAIHGFVSLYILAGGSDLPQLEAIADTLTNLPCREEVRSQIAKGYLMQGNYAAAEMICKGLYNVTIQEKLADDLRRYAKPVGRS